MVTAVVSLTGLGLVAAIGLSLASKKFHVDVDPRLETIEGILPALNCGACGYAGCAGFAIGLLEIVRRIAMAQAGAGTAALAGLVAGRPLSLALSGLLLALGVAVGLAGSWAAVRRGVN